MNEIAEIDQVLLSQIKKRLEQLAGLPVVGELSQKDFDFLIFYLQDKTGQNLSLTTIKRIWKNDFQRLPHLSTLNMLTQLAYGCDWHAYKKDQLMLHHTAAEFPAKMPTKSRKSISLRRVAFAVLALVAVGSVVWYLMNNRPIDTTKIQFTAKVTADQNIPNSVIFSYDVVDLEAEPFSIQQSWDPAKKVIISKQHNKQTDIYYEPGYHYAKLMGNGRVLKEIPVHIKYNDWFVRFRLPDSELLRVTTDEMTSDGSLALKEDYIRSIAGKLGSKFQLGYMLSKDFDMTADDLQVNASVRFDSLSLPACPMMNLLIKGDQDYAWITVGNKGCESNLGLKVGYQNVNGKNNDLSVLGMDVFEWQRLSVKLEKGFFELSINGKVVHRLGYTNQLGELKELDFFFNGIGGIDDIKVKSLQDRSQLSLGY